MPVPFNTHEVIQELQELGFPTAQAEGLTAVLLRTAQASQEQLATMLDLAELKAELKTEIATLRGELRAEIRDAKNSMLTWTIGVLGTLDVLGFGLLYTLIQRGVKP
jgi:hypothetical protein